MKKMICQKRSDVDNLDHLNHLTYIGNSHWFLSLDSGHSTTLSSPGM